MNLWTVPKASLPPALVLGGLVAFTFLTLQNYGPESTLRKFHASLHSIYSSQMNNKGIPKADWAMLRSSLREDIGEPGMIKNSEDMQVIQLVLAQYQAGATYSLARMDRYPQEVRIAVTYTIPNRPPTWIVWVVDKVSEREWKVDAEKTLSAMSKGLP